MTSALVIAAPSSGAGKTTVALGLMAALRARGVDVRAAKSGPDYIDPAFHGVATGAPSVNLDPWAMSPDDLRARATAQGGDILIVEAAMGVLDAGADGRGSAADLAEILGAALVLVVDIAKTGQSAALAPAGLRALRPDLDVAGVILNRAGSARHTAIARSFIQKDIPVFGALPRDPTLGLAERHLGLVQAEEIAGLDDYLGVSAALMEANIAIDAIIDHATPLSGPGAIHNTLPPIGQRIAVARDVAFAFSYPHVLTEWKSQGAEITFFSPLANETPDPDADAIFLPGGYPELHAGRLATADLFRGSMKAAARQGTLIYGECGGFMVLGEGLIDADGAKHEMLGLLALTTSFENPSLTLGYRRLAPLGGPFGGPLAGHEFHYATIVHEGPSERLFAASDALGQDKGEIGLRRQNVSGSFAHVICPSPRS